MNFKKYLLLFAGHSFVGLGILGIFLPVMPTTIFLILAATCYAKSSQRMYDWLHYNKYFGEYLRNYREKKGTPVSVKIFSISFLWLTIGATLYFAELSIWIQILLIIIAISVTIHVSRIKTLSKEKDLENSYS